MKQISIYLYFNGKCEEALNYYTTVFGGNIETLQYFREGPESSKIPDNKLDQVMHALYKAGEFQFMASDAINEVTFGDNIELSLTMETEEELKKIFKLLSNEGKIILEPKKQFWGSIFGIIQDRYGIVWQLSYDL